MCAVRRPLIAVQDFFCMQVIAIILQAVAYLWRPIGIPSDRLRRKDIFVSMNVESVRLSATGNATNIKKVSGVAFSRPLLWRRIPPGFRLGELLVWLAIHLSWPLMAGAIYHVAGKFNDPAYMSMKQFATIQVLVNAVKAICILPMWWLFFVRLKPLHYYLFALVCSLLICF